MAKKAYGTTIKIGLTEGGTYVTLGDLTEIQLPTISKDTIESYHYNSDGISKYRGGLVDTGEISFTTLGFVNENDIDSTHMPHTFEDLLTNDTAIFVKYSTPDDSSEFRASGIVTGVERIFSVDEALKNTITIKLTSAITQIG